MTMRSITVLALLSIGLVPAAWSQVALSHQPSAVSSTESRRLIADSFRRNLPHYGKWLTAAGTVAFTVMAASEHRQSRRNWDALLEICRSADDACTLGSNGRYVRGDAEQLYQQSRYYDKRANRLLLGAQASLLVTTALFIIDLHPGEGPDNIPFPGGLAVTALPDGAAVGMRVAF